MVHGWSSRCQGGEGDCLFPSFGMDILSSQYRDTITDWSDTLIRFTFSNNSQNIKPHLTGYFDYSIMVALHELERCSGCYARSRCALVSAIATINERLYPLPSGSTISTLGGINGHPELCHQCEAPRVG